MNRRVAGLLAVAALALAPALAAAPAYAAPEGQITWAVHFTIAPVWFDPGEHTYRADVRPREEGRSGLSERVHHQRVHGRRQ
jgi:hypothetical protein